MLGLRWSDIDRKVGEARLRDSKSGDPRTLPLAGQLQVVIERIRSFRGAWDAAFKTAGIPHMRFHDLRRSAVRNMENAGVPRSTAMKITGHKTESVYSRYAIVSEPDKLDALRKMETYLANKSKEPARVVPMRKHGGAS